MKEYTKNLSCCYATPEGRVKLFMMAGKIDKSWKIESPTVIPCSNLEETQTRLLVVVNLELDVAYELVYDDGKDLFVLYVFNSNDTKPEVLPLILDDINKVLLRKTFSVIPLTYREKWSIFFADYKSKKFDLVVLDQ